MEARAVFHNSCNKSDKRSEGNKPEWGQMISVVLNAVRAAARRRQINYLEGFHVRLGNTTSISDDVTISQGLEKRNK